MSGGQYHTLVEENVIFPKNLFKKSLENISALILLKIVPLSQHQTVLFFNNSWFYHVQIRTKKVLWEDKLSGKVFDAVAVNSQKIVLTIIQKKSVQLMDLKSKKIQQVYKITSDSVYNSKRQAAHFFLSKLYTFSQSQGYYLQQQLVQQRKIKLVYFPQNQASTSFEKENKQFQVKQFEAKNFMLRKFDQISLMVKFKQNPQENGRFSFQVINLQNDERTQFRVQHANFVLYSTIIDIKKLNEEKYIICINSKNSQHQILAFNCIQKTLTLVHVFDSLIRDFIMINRNLGIGFFSLFGKDIQEPIKAINLQNGKLVDQIQTKIQNIVATPNQSHLIEFGYENRSKASIQFKMFGLLDKKINFFKIMENLKLDTTFNNDFMQQILRMFV